MDLSLTNQTLSASPQAGPFLPIFGGLAALSCSRLARDWMSLSLASFSLASSSRRSTRAKRSAESVLLPVGVTSFAKFALLFPKRRCGASWESSQRLASPAGRGKAALGTIASFWQTGEINRKLQLYRDDQATPSRRHAPPGRIGEKPRTSLA